MPSGEYTFDDGNKSRADTSFRACVIALLIFLLFCVTIIIILLVVKKDASPGRSVGNEHSGKASKHTADETEKSKTPPDADRRAPEVESEETTSTTPTTSITPAPVGMTSTDNSTIPSSTEKMHESHAAAGSSNSSEDRSSTESKHTNTSTDYSTSTSTEHSDLTGMRRSSEGRHEPADNFTSTSTELPLTTSTENSTSTEMNRTSEDESTSTGNVTSTSTEHPAIMSTRHNSSSDDRVTTTGNLTITSTELPTSTSTGSSDFPEPRTSSEDRVVSTTTSTEHPSSTSEPPTTPPFPPRSEKTVTCESAECKKLAAHMLSTMGHGADPCKQFYEYACGGLRENKYLLEPDYADEAWQRISDMVEGITSDSQESYRKFQTLIESCKNYDPVKEIKKWKEAVRSEMMDLGNITLEDTDFSGNFTHLFLGLLQHDRPFITEVTLDVNDAKPSRFAIKVFPAQMAENQLYPEDNGALECQAKAANKHKKLNQIYHETLNCMNKGIGRTKAIEAAKETLIDLGIFSISEEAEKLNKALNDYGEFLDLNIKALSDRATQRLKLQTRDPDTITIAELNEVFEDLKVNWSAIIQTLIGRELKEDESIQLYSTRYFREINLKFKMRRRQLHNALLVAFATALHRDLVAEQRWRRHADPTHCTRLAARLLPDAASALYLRSFSDELRSQLEQQARDFVFDITSTFLDELERANWLNDTAYTELKNSLEYKMMHMKISNITDMPEVMDIRKLDEALESLTIDKTEFIKNAITLMVRNRKLLYSRIDDEPIKHIWTHFVAPYDTTSVSLYSLNLVAIPLAVVQKPFFHPDYPSHIRMAGYGFTVAHEMAHHIDPIGMQYNTTINKSTYEKYKEEIVPSISVWKRDVNIEFANLTGSDKHQNVPFEFTENDRLLKRNEFFADKIAIQLAYKTYKITQKKAAKEILPYLPLTNDQSFFVFLAQKYCTKMDYIAMVLDFFESPEFPPETRVKNMMEDNPAFYNTFNCSVTEKTDHHFPNSSVDSSDTLSEGRMPS